MKTLRMFVLTALALAPAGAFAQTPADGPEDPGEQTGAQTGAQTDRVTFGGDVWVRDGEVVEHVVTMGGDARVEGRVTGDVVTLGGDVRIEPTGEVLGDLVTLGGAVDVAPEAKVGGERVDSLHFEGDGFDGNVMAGPWSGWHDWEHGGGGHGGGVGAWIVDALASLVSYALLFVLGLLLMGVARERLDALQVVLVRSPLRSFGTGLLGFVSAVVAIVVLAITIIGIPAAVVTAFLLPFALYVGLAAAASVLGAALPVEALQGKPVLQLAAGCGALFLASLVPFAGDVAVAIAAAMGLGALVVTRFGKHAPDPGPSAPAGPYRTQGA